ncbi:SDR family NAD(P)-dependent oxidoreductase [Streptomyces sp. KM273126]|uniref:oxidoreductase n=1 Tax=Streptomyces sp. KM273126 TaxID=2545247 RepID=UPI00103E3DA3|nr:oxidoreductase [Streptomyces sp. KM273126]MBA2813302.1 SDR family NAD(P)-dependent oxidoreductase [Streptomyces sp. KM273126]
MSAKAALVTGASSGIGETVALKLQELGYAVYGAARHPDRLSRVARAGVLPLTMDVTDDKSMRAGVGRIIAEMGRMDVLVNNAGYGSYGAVEDVPLDEARRQAEVNVFGAMRLSQLVLPYMREQRSGKIVNVTSMGGRFHSPLGGWYHAGKFALEALSDCLRMEARPFGVDVVVIEPGNIRTEGSSVTAEKLREASGEGPYAAQAAAVLAALTSEANARRESPPSVIADAIATAVSARKPKTRYAAGFGARPLIALRGIVSDRAFDALISRAIGIPQNQPRT